MEQKCFYLTMLLVAKTVEKSKMGIKDWRKGQLKAHTVPPKTYMYFPSIKPEPPRRNLQDILPPARHKVV
jgi:hypothetical protein